MILNINLWWVWVKLPKRQIILGGGGSGYSFISENALAVYFFQWEMVRNLICIFFNLKAFWFLKLMSSFIMLRLENVAYMRSAWENCVGFLDTAILESEFKVGVPITQYAVWP